MAGDEEKERRVHKDSDEYFDRQFEEKPLYIGPGDFECSTDQNVMLVGKVGTGVIICVHDPEARIGGMVHVMLPEALIHQFPNLNPDDKTHQHVENLIERFINALKKHGAGKNRIRIKLFGGTTISEDLAESGLMNYIFAKDYILRKGLIVASVDIGGIECRRIEFQPFTGQIGRRKLRRQFDIDALREAEQAYFDKVAKLGTE